LSQQAWGITILHEIIHSFLAIAGLSGSNLADHEYMIFNFAGMMAGVLQSAFPGMGDTDAAALALSGMKDALYGDDGTPDPTWSDFILDFYGVLPSDVSAAWSDYSSGVKGTICGH